MFAYLHVCDFNPNPPPNVNIHERILPLTCCLLVFLTAGEPVRVLMKFWRYGVVSAKVILDSTKVNYVICHLSTVNLLCPTHVKQRSE